MRWFSTRTVPTPPTGLRSRSGGSKRFPLPFRDSWNQWIRRKRLRQAEEDVLKCVGLSPEAPQPPFRVDSIDVDIGSGAVVNELSVSTTPRPSRHIVLLHGYGASKGFFFHNFRTLASIPGVQLHALDWLGYGRSTRVSVPRFPRSATRVEKVLAAEQFFCGSLEAWRRRRNIPRFSILSHSLGAYLACSYAYDHPELVDRILLASPASVPRTGDAIPLTELGLEHREIKCPPPLQVPQWFRWGWERHWSPFEVVRWAGPWGPKLVSMWTSRRFRMLHPTENQALQRYAYTMFNAPGSGEYLLNCLLAPGGSGRWPLVDRIHQLSNKIPTLWMYGDHDWMDSTGGREAVRKIRANGGLADLAILPDSGHHLYIDNSAEFNKRAAEFFG